MSPSQYQEKSSLVGGLGRPETSNESDKLKSNTRWQDVRGKNLMPNKASGVQ